MLCLVIILNEIEPFSALVINNFMTKHPLIYNHFMPLKMILYILIIILKSLKMRPKNTKTELNIETFICIEIMTEELEN